VQLTLSPSAISTNRVEVMVGAHLSNVVMHVSFRAFPLTAPHTELSVSYECENTIKRILSLQVFCRQRP